MKTDISAQIYSVSNNGPHLKNVAFFLDPKVKFLRFGKFVFVCCIPLFKLEKGVVGLTESTIKMCGIEEDDLTQKVPFTFSIIDEDEMKKIRPANTLTMDIFLPEDPKLAKRIITEWHYVMSAIFEQIKVQGCIINPLQTIPIKFGSDVFWIKCWNVSYPKLVKKQTKFVLRLLNFEKNSKHPKVIKVSNFCSKNWSWVNKFFEVVAKDMNMDIKEAPLKITSGIENQLSYILGDQIHNCLTIQKRGEDVQYEDFIKETILNFGHCCVPRLMKENEGFLEIIEWHKKLINHFSKKPKRK